MFLTEMHLGRCSPLLIFSYTAVHLSINDTNALTVTFNYLELVAVRVVRNELIW